METAPSTSSSADGSAPPRSHRGRFVWHELLVPDTSTAIKFYPRVMGWTASTMEVPGGGPAYTMFMNGTQGVAGIQQHPAGSMDGVAGSWLPYMAVDDADVTFRDALAAGATELMSPTNIPTVGKIAIMRDPEGAQFAIIRPEPAGTPEVTPKAGEFAWHEMAANDEQASFAFYQRLFGWEKKHEMDMGKDGVYRMFGRGEFTYGGFMRRAEGMPPASWNSYVRVADLDAALEALKAAGGKVFMGPHEVPNDDRVVVAADDQGAVISLVGKIVR